MVCRVSTEQATRKRPYTILGSKAKSVNGIGP